jgi:hypothetical protein
MDPLDTVGTVDDEPRPTAKAEAHEQDSVLRLDTIKPGKTRRGNEYFSMGSVG